MASGAGRARSCRPRPRGAWRNIRLHQECCANQRPANRATKNEQGVRTGPRGGGTAAGNGDGNGQNQARVQNTRDPKVCCSTSGDTGGLKTWMDESTSDRKAISIQQARAPGSACSTGACGGGGAEQGLKPGPKHRAEVAVRVLEPVLVERERVHPDEDVGSSLKTGVVPARVAC